MHTAELIDFKALVAEAKDILAGNWTGKFTKPAPNLYPHQWNWDAGFIAIGYSHYYMDRAESELRSLFSGQWDNGMVPQIIFNPEFDYNYFPSSDFWETWRSFSAPENKKTSGITMPPVHGFVLQHIYDNAKDKMRALNFVKEMFPKILKMHHYFYNHRDPFNEGLVYIRHPWESGTDNSPTWDAPMERITFDKIKIPPYKRKDLDNGHAEHRPTDYDYNRYIHLIDIYRKCDYNEEAILERCPFVIQDPLFNCILVKSNQALIELATLIDEDVEQLTKWNELSIKSMNEKLWNPKTGIYDAYDLHNDERIEMQASSGLIPVYAHIPNAEQAQQIVDRLLSKSFSGSADQNTYLCPSYNPTSPKFNPKKYWRGPVWINMNWMLHHGLKHYGFTDLAEQLKQESLELINHYGFYEYFDPIKDVVGKEKQGYGSHRFSWSAALCIDFLQDEEDD
ncbi:MAG: trehalase family glycosidase [Tunicatimonas sp.]|uniref:amylo-alpha-1,6-glucosidase n=1 Tax=Tunicatimonas sp. TaxID=1940096 RepID=UPI003C744F49